MLISEMERYFQSQNANAKKRPELERSSDAFRPTLTTGY